MCTIQAIDPVSFSRTLPSFITILHPVMSAVSNLVYNATSSRLNWLAPGLTPVPENASPDYTYEVDILPDTDGGSTSLYNTTTNTTAIDLSSALQGLVLCGPQPAHAQVRVTPRALLRPTALDQFGSITVMPSDDTLVDLYGPQATTALPFDHNPNDYGYYAISEINADRTPGSHRIVVNLKLNTPNIEGAGSPASAQSQQPRCQQQVVIDYNDMDMTETFSAQGITDTTTEVSVSLGDKEGQFNVHVQVLDQRGTVVANSSTTLTFFGNAAMPTTADGTSTSTSTTPASTPPLSGGDNTAAIVGAVVGTVSAAAAVAVGSTVLTALACKYGLCRGVSASGQSYEMKEP